MPKATSSHICVAMKGTYIRPICMVLYVKDPGEALTVRQMLEPNLKLHHLADVDEFGHI